ncbi:MAG TPA: cytochrome c oxidase subunit 3 [Ilumatobacteraceae bacterium]|nr:cytochrome c oxidase subunit 3 [Ilumatobacteraceae bacterium]
MLALPPAPAPAPRRQLFIGASLIGAGGATLIGGMLATYMRFRDAARSGGGTWKPDAIAIPEVASNIMLFSFIAIGVFVQWAVYSAKRGDKKHTGMALGLNAVIGLAIINAQAAVWAQIELPVNGAGDISGYGIMFYAVTGTFFVLLITGVVFTLITAFRYLGGRTSETEIVTAHAIYWYFLTAAFCMLWYVVYVMK